MMVAMDLREGGSRGLGCRKGAAAGRTGYSLRRWRLDGRPTRPSGGPTLGRDAARPSRWGHPDGYGPRYGTGRSVSGGQPSAGSLGVITESSSSLHPRASRRGLPSRCHGSTWHLCRWPVATGGLCIMVRTSAARVRVALSSTSLSTALALMAIGCQRSSNSPPGRVGVQVTPWPAVHGIPWSSGSESDQTKITRVPPDAARSRWQGERST